MATPDENRASVEAFFQDPQNIHVGYREAGRRLGKSASTVKKYKPKGSEDADGKCKVKRNGTIFFQDNTMRTAAANSESAVYFCDAKCEQDIQQPLKLYLLNTRGTVRDGKQLPGSICRADLLTDNEIIEIEVFLSRPKIYEAIGQLMIYRHNVKVQGQRHLVIVAGGYDRHMAGLIRSTVEIGIEVRFWDGLAIIDARDTEIFCRS